MVIHGWLNMDDKTEGETGMGKHGGLNMEG
jgi:hypothetical protein